MAEPFSISVGIVGVLSLTIQIFQVAIQFGLDWKDAPKDVKAFGLEIRSLQITLAEMQRGLFSNPAFEEACEGRTSALLSHLKTDDSSQDIIKELFADCETRLKEALKNLRLNEGVIDSAGSESKHHSYPSEPKVR